MGNTSEEFRRWLKGQQEDVPSAGRIQELLALLEAQAVAAKARGGTSLLLLLTSRCLILSTTWILLMKMSSSLPKLLRASEEPSRPLNKQQLGQKEKHRAAFKDARKLLQERIASAPKRHRRG